MAFAPTQIKPASAGWRKKENPANGIRAYTDKTRRRGLKKEKKKERKPGEWNSRLHKQNPPPRVEERKKERKPGEWNSRLHRQNPPPRVEEINKERKPGEWNSRLHKQNPPPRVEEIKKENRANGIKLFYLHLLN